MLRLSAVTLYFRAIGIQRVALSCRRSFELAFRREIIINLIYNILFKFTAICKHAIYKRIFFSLKYAMNCLTAMINILICRENSARKGESHERQSDTIAKENQYALRTMRGDTSACSALPKFDSGDIMEQLQCVTFVKLRPRDRAYRFCERAEDWRR